MKFLTTFLAMLALVAVVGCKKEAPKKEEAAKPKTEEVKKVEKPIEKPAE